MFTNQLNQSTNKSIRKDLINYINNLSLFVMFTNQLNQSTKNHQVEKKSLLTPYSISGIPFGFKIQKPSKRIVSRVFMWAQMDSNHRPSDYESDALTN